MRYGQSTETFKLAGLVIQAIRLWLPSNLPKFELQLPGLPFLSETTQTAARRCVHASTQNYEPLAMGAALERGQLVSVS